MEEHIIDIIGWIGSLLLGMAYWLISKGRVKSNTFSYQLLNIVGSILLFINTFYYSAYRSSAVNTVWAIIGGYWFDAVSFQIILFIQPPSMASETPVI